MHFWPAPTTALHVPAAVPTALQKAVCGMSLEHESAVHINRTVATRTVVRLKPQTTLQAATIANNVVTVLEGNSQPKTVTKWCINEALSVTTVLILSYGRYGQQYVFAEEA